jgi:hypothetical protein
MLTLGIEREKGREYRRGVNVVSVYFKHIIALNTWERENKETRERTRITRRERISIMSSSVCQLVTSTLTLWQLKRSVTDLFHTPCWWLLDCLVLYEVHFDKQELEPRNLYMSNIINSSLTVIMLSHMVIVDGYI